MMQDEFARRAALESGVQRLDRFENGRVRRAFILET